MEKLSEFANAFKVFTAGLVAAGMVFASVAAGVQTVTRSSVPTEVHNSIPTTGGADVIEVKSKRGHNDQHLLGL